MRTKLLLVLTGLFLISPVFAHQQNKEKKVLKNADILLMVQNQFDDETLEKVIEASDTDFDISSDALVNLKSQGVSSAVLRAMLQATLKQKRAANPVVPAPASSASLSSPTDTPDATTKTSSPASPTKTSVVSGTESSSPSSASSPAAPAPTAPPSSAPTAAASVAPPPATVPAPMGGMPVTRMGPSASPQLAAMQSQMAMLGLGNLGGMFGGMMNMSYTPEQLPHVFLLDLNKAKQEVAASMAQIAQTKLKTGAPGPGGMALRSLATQGLSFAAMGAGPAGMMAMSAFSMASGFMPGMRSGTPSVTYVWGLPGRQSNRELNDHDPIFQLNYGGIPGVDPDAFEPAIVRLTQTPDNYRLVGATQSKMSRKDMLSGGGPENGKWISEDRWPTRVSREERGFYVLRVEQPLQPGEYAIVLRPVKGYKANPSGLGGHAQVFYSVWDFSVPGATPDDNGKKKKKK